jgi:hypothetical protein
MRAVCDKRPAFFQTPKSIFPPCVGTKFISIRVIVGEKSPLRSKPQLTGEQTAQACDIADYVN